MVGSLWKGEWFIWTLRLGKGTKNAKTQLLPGSLFGISGLKEAHSLLCDRCHGPASQGMTGRGNLSSTDLLALYYNESQEPDRVATRERWGIRKPAFSSQIQAVFSNPYLSAVKMIIFLFIYNCITLTIDLESRERGAWLWFSYSNRSSDTKPCKLSSIFKRSHLTICSDRWAQYLVLCELNIVSNSLRESSNHRQLDCQCHTLGSADF